MNMDGLFALCIAILGCDIKQNDLKENEEFGMRRYPKSAEDAFRCYDGKRYEYESKFPSYYDIEDRYNYRKHENNRKVA